MRTRCCGGTGFLALERVAVFPLLQKSPHPQRMPGERRTRSRGSKNSHLAHPAGIIPACLLSCQVWTGTQTKKPYNDRGFIKTQRGGLQKARSAGGREGKLCRFRPYEVAVPTRDKQRAAKDRAIPRMPPGCEPLPLRWSWVALGPEKPCGKAGRVSAGQPKGRVQRE